MPPNGDLEDRRCGPNCTLLPFYGEASILNATILVDRVLKEVIKVRWDPKGGALSQQNLCPCKVRGRDPLSPCMQKKSNARYSEKKPSAIQKKRSRWKPILLAFDLGLKDSRTMRKYISVV